MGTKEDTRLSATQRAYEEIRNRILSGELSPGERLTIRAMADLTGVSTIPVVQALHQLESDGLIESFPQWGSRVIVLNRETTRDRYLLREAVECQVARILATHIAPDDAQQLGEMAEELDCLLAANPMDDAFWDLDRRFHQTMARYTDSRSLLRALEHISLFRLLQKTREQVAMQHIELPANLHRSLVKAILSGDPDAAERQMREHIRASTTGWLFPSASGDPDGAAH
jgi:DNA-binding GntR family transcriptional regulator